MALDIPASVIESFPTRALTVRKVLAVSMTFSIVINFFIMLILVAVVGVVSYLAIPGLMRDYEIAKNPVSIDASIGGKCKTYKGIFVDCDITITYKGQTTKRSIMFIDFHSGDYYVEPVILAENPALITVDLAVNKIWNRIVTLGAILLLFIGLIIYIPFSYLRGRKMHGLLYLMQNSQLFPMLVPVKVNEVQGVVTAHYKWEVAGKLNKYFATYKVKKEGGPLIVPTNDVDNLYALGVVTHTQPIPILLDSKLLRCDMTETERDKILAAIVSLTP